ncbi:hypothetical protein [Vibrio sp. 10N.237.312.B06]|uniref:hypothetical protein n=1 Tax=Vibrio sp. 10N.237.312.B06 TaxID=3229974 RepID=UPI00354DA9E0
MQNVVLTAEQVQAIAESFAIYGFIGVLGALFFYDALAWLALKSVRRLGAFLKKSQSEKTYDDVVARRARAKISR